MLGFATTPREESAAYIKDWLAEFHKEPTYLFDILTDVNRAARMISERLACEQEPETRERFRPKPPDPKPNINDCSTCAATFRPRRFHYQQYATIQSRRSVQLRNAAVDEYALRP